MDYGYKPTTNGRALLAACLASEQPLKLTRVAVGSGAVPEGTDLADMHQLIQPVAEGTIGERRHEGDSLYLTVQYDNSGSRDVGAFFLSEFMVYAQDPESGQETDLLYATLGDYRQPVPAYDTTLPPSVWKFPLVLVVSDQIQVSVTAPAGLVTADEVEELVDRRLEEAAGEGTLLTDSQKGQPGGVAGLDEEGKVPVEQLPAMDYISLIEKGQPGGVATLDSDGKMPAEQLPAGILAAGAFPVVYNQGGET